MNYRTQLQDYRSVGAQKLMYCCKQCAITILKIIVTPVLDVPPEE